MSEIGLHDFILLKMFIDWEGATLQILVDSSGGQKKLIFENLEEFELPRKLPWGYSESINSFEQESKNVYKIEMQSGDVFKIVAGKCLFE